MQSPLKEAARLERAEVMFSMWNEREFTFDQIAKEYGISKQRVSQIISWYKLHY